MSEKIVPPPRSYCHHRCGLFVWAGTHVQFVEPDWLWRSSHVRGYASQRGNRGSPSRHDGNLDDGQRYFSKRISANSRGRAVQIIDGGLSYRSRRTGEIQLKSVRKNGR